jgi:segregation and condensation protein A
MDARMAAVAEHGAGEGASPELRLDGFAGSLAFLLRVARAQQVNLAMLPVLELVEQLTQALQRAPARLPLGQKADWVVMGAWILLLRSQLLLPPETPAQQAAENEAGALRDRLLALQDAQALAAWLDRRPVLGRDVFGRGWEEYPGGFGEVHHSQVDVIGFLWAAMELFDAPTDAAETETSYRPAHLDLYAVPDACLRILRLLATPGERTLAQLLPAPDPVDPARPPTRLRRCSAWTSTLLASLELAKQGELVLAQDGVWGPIAVRPASAATAL